MAWIAVRVIRALVWLGGLFNVEVDWSNAGQVVRVIGYVIGFVAVALAAWLLTRALDGVIRRLRAGVSEEGAAATGPTELTPRRALRGLLDEAGRLAAAGDYRHALRCLYQALILTLHVNRLLDYDANRTNREYLTTLRSTTSGDLAATFGEATSLFEQRWYGCQQAGQADVDRMSGFVCTAEDAKASPPAP